MLIAFEFLLFKKVDFIGNVKEKYFKNKKNTQIRKVKLNNNVKSVFSIILNI